MLLVDSPTERTTAATDAVLAILALAGALHLYRVGPLAPWKTTLWGCVFGLLCVAATLGAVAHGFQLSKRLRRLIWHPVYLSLGLLVALCVVGAVHDVFGESTARQILPLMIGVGLGFYGTILLWPDNFLIFDVYQTVAMVFPLAVYAWAAYQGRIDGAWLMALGFLASITGAGIRARRILSFTLVWSFDHNGIHHLLQTAGSILLLAGLTEAVFPAA